MMASTDIKTVDLKIATQSRHLGYILQHLESAANRYELIRYYGRDRADSTIVSNLRYLQRSYLNVRDSIPDEESEPDWHSHDPDILYKQYLQKQIDLKKDQITKLTQRVLELKTETAELQKELTPAPRKRHWFH